MSIKLYEHNQTAYDAALDMLASTGKAAVIHPTGTGKSFIAFKLCENFPDKTVCWLSPSEYIFKTQVENLKKTTGGYAPDNIRFFTYSKLTYMTDEEMRNIRPDIFVCDEFHRAGAEVWGGAVRKLLEMYENVPILGLSATNIRYLDNQRDMADELFDGNVASEMTLGDAIARGILNPPIYITALYSYEKELEKYEKKIKHARFQSVRAKAQETIDRLRRALEMADGLDAIFEKHMKDKSGKYIVFCENYEHMREMTEKAPEWFRKVDEEPHIYSVYSDDPETSAAFAEFKTDGSCHLKLLFCIDMLNEGIHVDGISGVILLRPTVSPIVYKQQIGRALSASKEKEPIIFDIVNNFENLYSISAVQEEIEAAITYYRYLGENGKIVNERFRLIDEAHDCRRLFEELEGTLSTPWEEMYQKAKAYYESHGNLNVPKRYKTEDGCSLGNWVLTQRKVYNGQIYGKLNETRIAMLNAIGMCWESGLDASWNRYYAAAKRYYEENGDLQVPAQYVTKEGVTLGSWIINLRTGQKSGIRSAYLTEERKRALDEIEMCWDVFDYLWERNYAAAAEYRREHGDLDVPYDYVSKDGIKVGVWIANLRQTHKRVGKRRGLTEEQIKRLEEIGMLWDDKYTRQWNAGYAEAEKYYKANGDLNVPYSYTARSGYKLGAWISNQREARSKMKPERKEKLDSIGMVWKKPDPWEARYELAKAYYEEHGDLNVPADYVADGVWLGKWISEQKQVYLGKRKNKRLNAEQIRRLEDIGIAWRSFSDAAWDIGYRYAKEYYEEHGNLEVPLKYRTKDGYELGAWISRIRSARNGKGIGRKPSPELIQRLSAIGMQWKGKAELQWEKGYKEAKAYYLAHGNLEVQSTYITVSGFKLGRWIANQRYRKNVMSERQKALLNEIEMRWGPVDAWSKNYALARKYYETHGT